MASYENTTIKKMNYNGQKVKKWYHDGVRVFTAGNVVTYHVNPSTSYQEEVDSEASCLSPTTFTPELSGYTFVGWREDTTASGEVLSEKIMGDEPISLYAVFKKTFTLSFANNYASGGATNPVSGNQYYNNGNIVNPIVTLPADGYTRSGLTFIKWVLGTVGTKITLTADTTTRAVCKYSDMVPTYISWAGAGVLNDNGNADYSVYVDGTKYSHMYFASGYTGRGAIWISNNDTRRSSPWIRSVAEFNAGDFLYQHCSGRYDGYNRAYTNGVEVTPGSATSVGPVTVALPNRRITIGCSVFDHDASESGANMKGIKFTGRTVS